VRETNGPSAPLGPHEEEVRHVGAGHQQYDPDRAEQDPQHASDIANHVVRQRMHIGLQPYRLLARLGWEPLEHARNQACHIVVRLRHRDASLEPSDAENS
jgi:hypothetical protein